VLDGIRRVVRVLRLSDRAAEKQTGLSGAQLFALHQLADRPVVSLNELAERIHTHQSSVSVVVQRLVDRKLVERIRARSDARRLELTLTARGRGVLRRAPEVAQERLVSALRQFAGFERATLARLLDRLATKMGAGGLPPAMLFEEERGRRKGAKSRGRPAKRRRRAAPASSLAQRRRRKAFASQ
jgi:DNA-binding MarR family transcriptional regulator